MEPLNKILITGATGFIGSHLTRRLVQEGFQVGIIKRENSNVWRINDSLDKISLFDADLCDTKEISKIISSFRPYAIFHLATYYAVEHKPLEIPLMVDTNILGTLNLLEASRDTVKLFINTSSCFVYRQSENKLRENSDLSPMNLYALTKMHAEQACTFYNEKYGLKTVTLRLFPPYGPFDNENKLIPYVIKSLLDGVKPKMTSGKQRWDFVYVQDIIDAYMKLLNVPEFPQTHETFNIGTGNAVSIQEVVSRIKEITGADVEPEWGAIPHRKNEVWYTCADTSKTQNFLRWQPKTNILKDGLEFTVDWYKNFWRRGR